MSNNCDREASLVLIRSDDQFFARRPSSIVARRGPPDPPCRVVAVGVCRFVTTAFPAIVAGYVA